MAKVNKKSLDEKINTKNQVNQTKRSGKETATEKTEKQLEKNFKETSESKENSNKRFEDLKPGEPIYGISIEYKKGTKPQLIDAKVMKVFIKNEDYENYGASYVEYQADGRRGSFNMWTKEISKNAIINSYSFWFLSKEDRDNYLKNNIPQRIESINKDIEVGEKYRKEHEMRLKRREAGEFDSLEEEIWYIKDQYDHIYDKETAKIMEEQERREIEAAKKRWANK